MARAIGGSETQTLSHREELDMSFLQTLQRFASNEQGMETVEWAVVAALIVAGLVAVITGLGTNVTNKFNALQTATT